MDPERWKRLSALLDQALSLPPVARERWLAALEIEDRSLAIELEALLADADALAGSDYLERAPDLAVWHGATLAGQVFGAWTLERSLGHGGMGSVWLARRSDGRYEGNAAIKLLNLALVGRAAEERFKREGDVLARLSHPHINRLIDAGIAPTGQPYLVLEFVDGERIDAWCDGERLDVDGRLALFLDVLAAVAHAHAQLIVHRDIKPTNILVDRTGAVKLVDFGIAKLVDDVPSGEATLLTREAGRVLTPEFAAPEQLLGQPVTTATDVYALGVLLYVLLVGRHPAGDAELPPAGLIHSIVDASPDAPSDAATSMRGATTAGLAKAADCRNSTPDRLCRRLRGDLDNIVAKALKKDPRERYASVDAFAEDLRRHRANEPVGARPDSLAYRAGKFVRRNVVPVALASMAFTAVLAGLAGTIVQARRAAEQRDFALKQVARVEAVNDLTSFLLYDAGHSGKPFTSDELLARGEELVERSSSPSTADLLVAIGNGYHGLEEGGNERRVLARAYALSRTDPDPAVRARAACAWGRALAKQGKREASERVLADALGDLPDRPQYQFDRVNCLLAGSAAARTVGDLAVSVGRAETAQILIAQHSIRSKPLEYVAAETLAEAYRSAAEFSKADIEFGVAFQKLKALGRDNTRQASTLFNNWGIARLQMGEPLRAEPLLRRAIEIGASDSAGTGAPPMDFANYGEILGELARYDEALQYLDRATTVARSMGEEDALNAALTYRVRINVLRGDFDAAERALDEVEPRLRRSFAPRSPIFAGIASTRSRIAQVHGDFAGAIALSNQAVDLARASWVPAYALPDVLRRRSELELAMGRPTDARVDAETAVELQVPGLALGTSSRDRGELYLTLGRALAAEERTTDAVWTLRAAAAELGATVGPDHPDTRLAEALRQAIAPDASVSVGR